MRFRPEPQHRSSQLEVSGTPFYAAPEQLEDPVNDTDGRSLQWDVYSFGVVAFELATGHLPRLHDLAEAHRAQGSPPISSPHDVTLPTLQTLDTGAAAVSAYG